MESTENYDQSQCSILKQREALGMMPTTQTASGANLRHQTFMDVCYELHKLHVEKDTRYRGSFHKTYKKYGLTATAIRLSDKFERMEMLMENPDMATVEESLEDTIMDFANYAIMTLVEFRLKKLGL